ncbi:MAG: SDR family NAD(P)-dependent oxidoreductase [Anaerolineae bacterium]
MVKIRDCVALVTGASAGIGRATAVALAQAGANVVITARRDDRLRELAAELADYPGERLVLTGDIQSEAFTQTLVGETATRFGRLDVLINNAGLGHHSLLADMPIADMRTIFDTNVFGLMALTQTAVSLMKRQGHGHIINISSIVSQRPLPNSGVYTASKTAVNFLSRSLRMELRRDNIRVTLVYPGLTATEFAQARLGRKGGNRFGLKGIPPQRVARKILHAIRYGREEVYITPTDWLFTHFCRLFPRSSDWIVNHVNNKA